MSEQIETLDTKKTDRQKKKALQMTEKEKSILRGLILDLIFSEPRAKSDGPSSS